MSAAPHTLPNPRPTIPNPHSLLAEARKAVVVDAVGDATFLSFDDVTFEVVLVVVLVRLPLGEGIADGKRNAEKDAEERVIVDAERL